MAKYKLSTLKKIIVKFLIKLHIPSGRFSEDKLRWKLFKESMAYCDETADVACPDALGWPQKMFFYEHCRLRKGCKIIQSSSNRGGYL